MSLGKYESRFHCFRTTLLGLTCCAAGAIALLLAGDGASAKAQAAAPDPAPGSQAASPSASSQDIVGIWQGTLHVAAAADHPEINLRIVNRISKDEKGNLKVLDYSIDQGGQAMVATTASFANGTLTYSIEGIGGKYEGTMSADGKTITGNWTQALAHFR